MALMPAAAVTAPPIVKIRGLGKTYAGGFEALKNVNLDIRRGEIFALLGPNGAGKTSTLECLEGLRAPSGGSLRVAGIDPAGNARGLRNLIGVQLQSAGLPESITPDEAMKIFCAYHGAKPRFDLLERLGLAEKRHAQFFELSTGSSAASLWPWRSRTTRPCCFWMSPPRGWMWRPGSNCTP